MHGHSIIQDVVVLYGLALVFLLLGSRLRLPGIISLIVTGVIAGPGGLGLVSSDESVRTLSEVGIALLLFMVGLDLSVHEIRRLWRNAVVGGGAQMAGTMLAVAPCAWWLLGPRTETLLFATNCMRRTAALPSGCCCCRTCWRWWRSCWRLCCSGRTAPAWAAP
jgi:Kef-type K+ transport system membrane component KefB